jgi:ATP-dependent Clp protease adaptor protein ClpS
VDAAAMSDSPEELHEILELEDHETLLVPMYHVVLLDDDDHSYDYVIEMLMDIFGLSQAKAYDLACIVDREKRVVVETTYKERAEMKRSQVHSYGADWRIPHCKGSMSATIEPADTRS